MNCSMFHAHDLTSTHPAHSMRTACPCAPCATRDLCSSSFSPLRSALEAAIRNEPDHRDREIQRQRDPRVHERQSHRQDIEHERDVALDVAADARRELRIAAVRPDRARAPGSCRRSRSSTARGRRRPPAIGAKWFSPIHAVVNGVSDSQNNKCRLAHNTGPLTCLTACSMWW